MDIEARVVMIPTDYKTESRIFLDSISETELVYTELNSPYVNKDCQYWHLYFVTDEPINKDEEGWLLESGWVTSVVKFRKGYDHSKYPLDKKIIATTDPDLIKNECDGCKRNKISRDINDRYTCSCERLPDVSDNFIKAFIKAYNEGSPIETVKIKVTSNGEWLFERSSGYGGDRCQKCQTWVYSDAAHVCECGVSPEIRDDNTIILSQAKTHTTKEVRELFRQFGSDVLPFGQVSDGELNKWLDENLDN